MESLTKREKKVLYGLVRWPNLSDYGLAKNLDLKRSTVTAIRNRLYSNGFYRKYYLPNFINLGHELMVVAYGGFNPKANFEMRLRKGLTKIAEQWNEYVFGFSTEKGFAASFICKNFTEFEKIRAFCFNKYGDCFKDVEIVCFPFELYKIIRFLDFAPILGKLFGFETQVKSITFKQSRFTLKKLDRKVMKALMRYPDKTDLELSKLTKISRTSFSKTKKKLENAGLIRPLNIPDFRKLGIELVALIHSRFAPKVSYEIRAEGHALIDNLPNHFTMITGDMEGIILGLYRNYTEYEEYYELLDSFYRTKGFFESAPMSAIYPIQGIKYCKINFEGLI